MFVAASTAPSASAAMLVVVSTAPSATVALPTTVWLGITPALVRPPEGFSRVRLDSSESGLRAEATAGLTPDRCPATRETPAVLARSGRRPIGDFWPPAAAAT